MKSDPPPGQRPARFSSEEDAALMRRIASGDTSAARILMERSLPVVMAIGHRMLRDPVEAEDVAQDTFIRAWSAAGRWQPGTAKLESWMARIATNLCLDRLRKKREAYMETPPEMHDESLSADEQLISSETNNAILMAIGRLPDRQRIALELCHFQGHSNIDAARELEISVDALESLLARARRKLKSILMPQRDELIHSLQDGQDTLTTVT